ncbi:hypothetical protein ACFO3D_05935 [Virgibacillus kekensis]|uniref:Cytochrome b561 domain-containing protein n=1 Tax=Virgibacillus kekensis TaxID=202261 RepID=A0ABV9DGQ4_9BACI
MNKWFFFNIALLALGTWNVINKAGEGIPTHIFFGFMGLIFILFNWTRHAVFSTIRDSSDRAKKIKYANLSKRILPFHRWIGTTALILILTHATLVIDLFGFQWQNPKIVSGLLTATVLTAVVTTGWMRRYRPSIKKRMTHLWLGISMFFLLLLHLLF